MTELKNEEFADTLTADDGSGEEEYVADCTVESDMELLLPPDYVPQESERISLYKELDGIERELDLQRFKLNLEDRFGKIPKETAELLRIPRLRYLARRLGIEKIMLKMGQMYMYFVDDSNQAYYRSPMFGKILNYMQAHPRRCRIREKNGRRSIVISDVPTVEEGVALLQEVISLNSL